MKEPLDPITVERIVHLCNLDMRPSTLEALFSPSVPKAVISQYRSQIAGSGKSGAVPTTTAWFFETYRRRLHAGYLATVYLQLRDSGQHHVDALRWAYDKYWRLAVRTMRDSVDDFNIERAFLLSKFLNSGELRLVRCACCDCVYLQHKNKLVNDRFCPVHNSLLPKQAVLRPPKGRGMAPVSDDTFPVEYTQSPAAVHGAAHTQRKAN